MIYPGKSYTFYYKGSKESFKKEFDKLLLHWTTSTHKINRRFQKSSRRNKPFSGHFFEDEFELRQLDDKNSEGLFLMKGKIKEVDDLIEVKLRLLTTNYFLTLTSMIVGIVMVLAYVLIYFSKTYQILLMDSYVNLYIMAGLLSIIPPIRMYQSLCVRILSDIVDWFDLD